MATNYRASSDVEQECFGNEPSALDIEADKASETAEAEGIVHDMMDGVPALTDMIHVARLGNKSVRLRTTMNFRGATGGPDEGYNHREIPFSQLPEIIRSAVDNYCYGKHGNDDPLHGGAHFYQHDREE
jgi:hypothetical protein